jgi:hypothetical protein
MAVPACWQVRHRTLLSGLGRWTARDPLEYADGAALYRYSGNSPISAADPAGLASVDTAGTKGPRIVVDGTVLRERCGEGEVEGRCSFNFVVQRVPANCTPVLVQRVSNSWGCGKCSGEKCEEPREVRMPDYWEIVPLIRNGENAANYATKTNDDYARLTQPYPCVSGWQRGELRLFCLEDLSLSLPIPDGWSKDGGVAMLGGCNGSVSWGTWAGTSTEPSFWHETGKIKSSASRIMTFQANCCCAKPKADARCRKGDS